MNAPLVKPLNSPRLVSRPPLAISVTLEACLISIHAARLALRCSEDQVIAWIGSGQLEWAFDLRAKKTTRSYIRILTQSVVKLQQPRTPLNLRRRHWKSWVASAPSFEEVFESIFRHHRPWIRTSELIQAWNCCSGHIRNLIELDFLEVARRAYLPNQARLVSRQSVAAFMEERRIP